MAQFVIQGAQAVVSGALEATTTAESADIRVRDGLIAEVAPGLVPAPDEEVFDATGCVVYPGWVNTHHHLFQSVLKAVPAGLNEQLFEWLGAVPYPRLMRISEEELETAALIGLSELLLSGTTTCADHHYVYHADMDPEMADVLFDVAERLGIRLVLCRGGSTEAGRHPNYPNDLVSESVDGMIRDVARLVERHHDPSPTAMRRVVMAPTTPTFSVAPDALRELAAAGRSMGLRLHTHLSETRDYVDYCREVHGMTPVQFCAEHDWLDEDVWFAHMVHVDDTELPLLARSGAGVAHCPQSNCRLGSGVARIPEMARRGIPVSVGVDGAASNEAADMLQETHAAWLVHRAVGGAADVTVDQVVHWGSRGGARILGLDGVGLIQAGYAADLAIYDLSQPRHFGLHAPATAPVVSGGSASLRYLFVDGVPRVRDGAIPGLDLAELRARAHRAVQRLT